MSKNKKPRERLTPVPSPKRKPAPQGRDRQPADGAAPTAPAAPDLSHIAAGLHALAVHVGDLKFDPANARKHPEENLEAIAGSLSAYGQRRPIVVNRRTMEIEAGNGLLQAALSLNWQHVAALFVDDGPARAKGFSLADNRTAELAKWDKEAVRIGLEDVDANGDERLLKMFSRLAEDVKLIPKEEAAPQPVEDTAVVPSATCPQCGHKFAA